MWLWAETLKRQRLGRGGWWPSTEIKKGQDNSNHSISGSNWAGKEGHVFGGNPTPPYQPYKESAIDSHSGAMAWPKLAEGEVIANEYEDQIQNDTTGLTGDKQGKEIRNFNVKELAMQEVKEDTCFSKWAQTGDIGLVAVQGPISGGNLREIVETALGLVSGQAKTNILEHEKSFKGIGGVQRLQARKQNIFKIWKRVSRSGGEETRSSSTTLALLDKRKGETGDINSDEQRHLK